MTVPEPDKAPDTSRPIPPLSTTVPDAVSDPAAGVRAAVVVSTTCANETALAVADTLAVVVSITTPDVVSAALAATDDVVESTTPAVAASDAVAVRGAVVGRATCPLAVNDAVADCADVVLSSTTPDEVSVAVPLTDADTALMKVCSTSSQVGAYVACPSQVVNIPSMSSQVLLRTGGSFPLHAHYRARD